MASKARVTNARFDTAGILIMLDSFDTLFHAITTTCPACASLPKSKNAGAADPDNAQDLFQYWPSKRAGKRTDDCTSPSAEAIDRLNTPIPQIMRNPTPTSNRGSLRLDALFHALDRPRKMGDGDHEEALRLGNQPVLADVSTMEIPHLFESSAMPAKALYHAMKAARRPKKPPALMMGGFGAPALLRCR